MPPDQWDGMPWPESFDEYEIILEIVAHRLRPCLADMSLLGLDYLLPYSFFQEILEHPGEKTPLQIVAR